MCAVRVSTEKRIDKRPLMKPQRHIAIGRYTHMQSMSYSVVLLFVFQNGVTSEAFMSVNTAESLD